MRTFAWRQAAAGVARRLGLTRTAFRAHESARALRARGNPAVGEDGKPLPPPLLMIQVVGHADADAFQRHGRAATEIIHGAVSRHRPVHELRVLDFGCGCGRVARHWPAIGAPQTLHGCDYNARAVKWCRRNLPFLDAAVNDLAPPLPYGDDEFDLVYALSVFTHLDADMQRAWMTELRRIVKPGGLIFFTIKGDRHAGEELQGDDLERYRRGDLVVTHQAAQGLNLCAAYANEDWVEANLLHAARLLERRNYGTAMMGGQDAYLIQTDG